jgi:C4-dicarboxylate-specific signal transduction histidine kinase
MELNGLLEYLNILSSLLSLLAVALVCWLRTIFATRKEIEAMNAATEKRLQYLEERQTELSGLVSRMEDMPKAADLHALRVALEHMDGTQRAIQAEMKGNADILHIVKSQCERMNAYLLEKGH